MNISLMRGSIIAFSLFIVFFLLYGCISGAGGGDGYGVGYYEPYGGDYGGWGSGYRVAPYRDHDHHGAGGGRHSASHAYRSAPASHAIPSIPSGGGGGRR
jgi:hypothetical protein